MRHLLLALILFLAACSSTVTRIATPPIQPDEVVLGQVDGAGSGFMLFQFIPIGQNDRFASAYSRALQEYPGTTRLVDIRIWEWWYWAYIGNGYNFHIEATAVGPKQPGK